MSRATILAITTLLLTALPLKAQKLHFQGRLLDKETNDPIAFAHINLVSSPGKGFLSTRDGSFDFMAVPDSPGVLEVYITFIGYETLRLKLQSGESNTYYLKSSAFILPSVAVTPFNAEEELLRKVIERIPDNYPTELERLTGTTLEEAFQDSLFQIPYYTSEAKVEADKQSYDKKRTLGNVKVIDGETTKYEAYTNTNIRIRAGIHNIHRFDFVMMRLGPLVVNRLDKYKLSILDTVSSVNGGLIRLRFSDTDYKGMFYINSANYAIERGEFEYTAAQLKKKNLLKETERHHLKFVTEYSSDDSLYRLRFINYRTSFTSGSKEKYPRFYLNNTFSINTFKSATEQIQFLQRLGQSHRMADELPLLGSDTAEVAVPGPKAPPAMAKSSWQVLTRFSFGVGLSVTLSDQGSYTTTLSAGPLNQTYRREGKKQAVVSSLSTMAYQISAGNELFFSWNIKKKELGLYSIGMQWNRPLLNSMRWHWLAGAQIGYRQMRQKLETFSSTDDFSIDDKSFDSGQLSVYSEQREFVFLPNLGLEFKLSALFHLRFQAFSHNASGSTTGLFLQEEDERWPWNRSSVFIDTEPGLSSSTDQLFKSNLSFSISLYIKY